jgi:hypothetical protein
MNRAVSLPPISDEDRQFLHYNPNTADLVAWAQEYARSAVLADRERRPADQEPLTGYMGPL